MPREADSEVLRTFVAVEIAEEVRRRAAEIVERLRAGDAGVVKWVDPRNLHLTIKFLGATRRADLPRLGAALWSLAAGAAPFDLELAGAGAFPNLRRPQVIWLGVTAGQGELAALAGAAEATCAELGWTREEKPYRAHLTLGRMREPRRGARSTPVGAGPTAALARALEAERDAAAGRSPVRRLALIESQLRPNGPTYTVLESFPLGGARGE